MSEQFPADLHHAERVVISVGNIMAFIQMASADEYPVHPIGESPEYKCQIDSSAAHDADQFNIGCVLLSGDSSQIGSAVRSPIAYKT
jgi:hypothetical protein